VRAVPIRDFTDHDWPQVWPIIRDVVRSRETFPYDPTMTEDDARSTWIESPPGRTTVFDDGRVRGTAKMSANRPGPGAHIATASFMVAADARGRGVGTALAEDALAWARGTGFAGMQFNAVAESNESAVRLYQCLGFKVLGTVPRAFEHPVPLAAADPGASLHTGHHLRYQPAAGGRDYGRWMTPCGSSTYLRAAPRSKS
jgi:GNAT superfamily N-acetyltransferase